MKCLFCDNDVYPGDVVCQQCIYDFHKAKDTGRIIKLASSNVNEEGMSAFMYSMLYDSVQCFRRAVSFIYKNRREALKPRSKWGLPYISALNDVRDCGRYILRDQQLSEENARRVLRKLVDDVVEGKEKKNGGY